MLLLKVLLVPNNKSSALVVYQQKTQAKKNKNRAKRILEVIKTVSKPKGMGKSMRKMSSPVSSFARALSNPFDPEVYGTRVPDPYPFPTAVYSSHSTTVIGCTSGSAVTSGCVAFLPNPMLSMMDIYGLTAPTSGNGSVTSTGMNKLNASVGFAGYKTYSSVLPSSLRGLLSSFRVVSWGIKISNLQPQLSATGRIIIAQVPIGDTMPGLADFTNATSANIVLPVFGSTVNSLSSSALLNLPTAVEIPVSNLVAETVAVNGMYTSPAFFDFKGTPADNTSIGNNLFIGDSNIVNEVLNVVTFTEWKDLTRCRGGTGIVVYFEGFPEGVSNALQIETIYHIEGSPIVSAVPGAMTSEANHGVSIGTIGQIESALQVVSSVSKAIRFIKEGADFVRGAAKGIRGAYRDTYR